MKGKIALICIVLISVLAVENTTETNETTELNVTKYLTEEEIIELINRTITLPDMSEYYNKSQIDKLLNEKETRINELQSQIDSLQSEITNLKSIIDEQKALIQEQKGMIETQRAIIKALETALIGEANKTLKIAKALEEGRKIYYNETTGEIMIEERPWYHRIGAWIKGLFFFR